MRRILSIITTLLLFASISQAQIIERYVKAIETVETDSSFVYRGEDIPVLDISYHEWSADSITWRKNYVSGDCFIRFSNDIKSTWAAYNVCTGMGSGTSQIDTILWTVNGITDTITEGTANLYLTSPDTISGSSTNFQDSLTHTHELYIVLDDNKDVETTGVSDGQVIKWNSITEEWEASNDLIGGGAAGYLTVGEQGGGVSVANVREILVENGRLTDNGVGSVSIDFLLDPVNGAQDFFRTDTLTIYEAVTDTFIEFSTVFPDNDYTLSNAYAIYNDNSRQNLVYDSIAADGFRVLSILDTAVVHYLAMRNLDSLGLAVSDQGKVLASGGDTELGYLNSKVDNTTIIVENDSLKAITVDSIYESRVYINSDELVNETLQGLNSHVATPHISIGGEITDLGTDSVAISAATAYIKTSNSDAAILKGVIVPADTLYIPPNINTSFFIDYNDGSPQFIADTAIAGRVYQEWDILLFATGVNLGDRIIIRDFKNISINPVYKLLLEIANTRPVQVLGDGISVADQSSLQFSTSVGAGLYGTEYEIIYPINTSSVDTFTRMYYDGSWQRVLGEQTVNNTHYNDTASGLVSLGSGKFTNKWLYYIEDDPNFWVVLDGQHQYGSYVDAYSVTAPSYLPPELNPFYAGSELIGKFIVQQGKSEFLEIQSSFSDNYGVPTAGQSKSYSFTSQGVGAGTYYIGGYYDVSATDANLTQASTTQSLGVANVSYASHPFVVAGGAGVVDAGVVGLRITGTRIEDDGTRTANYADTILTDITNQSLNEYTEGCKFIGTVVYELIVISGTPTTYSFDFNYGFVKYEDFGNKDFDVNGFEVVGTAGANDANFNITLIHHTADNWTYAATGFVITPTIITDLQTVHNTEFELVNGEPFAFKRSPLNYSEVINGSDSQGVVIQIDAGANNSVQILDAHIGVRILE